LKDKPDDDADDPSRIDEVDDDCWFHEPEDEPDDGQEDDEDDFDSDVGPFDDDL